MNHREFLLNWPGTAVQLHIRSSWAGRVQLGHAGGGRGAENQSPVKVPPTGSARQLFDGPAPRPSIGPSRRGRVMRR